jgi:hypothetical protein
LCLRHWASTENARHIEDQDQAEEDPGTAFKLPPLPLKGKILADSNFAVNLLNAVLNGLCESGSSSRHCCLLHFCLR